MSPPGTVTGGFGVLALHTGYPAAFALTGAVLAAAGARAAARSE